MLDIITVHYYIINDPILIEIRYNEDRFYLPHWIKLVASYTDKDDDENNQIQTRTFQVLWRLDKR